MEKENIIKLAKETSFGSSGLARDEDSHIYFFGIEELSKLVELVLATNNDKMDAVRKSMILAFSKDLELECGNRCNAEFNPCSARQVLQSLS